MRKILLLAGIFTVFIHNTTLAHSQYNQKQFYYVSNETEKNYLENKIIKQNQTTKLTPYIGLDLATSLSKFNSNSYLKSNGENYFKNTNNSLSFIIGLKYKYLGMEFFYQLAENGTKNAGDLEQDNIQKRIQLNYNALGTDIIGYIPLTQEIELLTSVGLAQYYFNTSDKTTIKEDTKYTRYRKNNDFDSYGIRLGLGVQYNIENLIAVRAMAHYIKMDDDTYIKNIMELSLGIRYMF